MIDRSQQLLAQFGTDSRCQSPASKIGVRDRLLNAADVAILSVQRDVSKIHSIFEASERLRSVGVMVLGSVVNGIRPTCKARLIDFAPVAATENE